MDEKKYVLAIDLGTSGPKVALVSTLGEIIGSEFEKTELRIFDGGGAEQCPDDWWRACMVALKRLVDKDLVPRKDIVAIASTGQWSGTVAVDENGKHLMDAMIWFDSRGADTVKNLMEGFPKISGYSLFKVTKWIRITGGCPSLSGKDSAGHILYIKHCLPEIYEKTHLFLEPKDYLNYRLTGRMISTYETMTLNWCIDNRDINNIKYDKSLLKMLGFDRKKLPDMIKSTDVVGNITQEVAEELGLNSDVKVMGGTPDVHAVLIGGGAIKDYEATLCIGTSSLLSCHVPFKKTDLLHPMASVPSGIPGRYFLAVEQETAAVCLTFLRDNIFCAKDELYVDTEGKDIYKIFDEMVSNTAPGADNLIFTPWLHGERCPVDENNIRGGFYNMSLKTTRKQMVRAVFEGVAFNARWMFIYAEKFVKRKFNQINIVGGGAKSDVWCQIYADILGYKVRQVKDSRHINAKGAAMLALDGLGYASFQEVADKTEYTKTFVPNPKNKEVYDKLFKEFLAIYKNNKKTYAKLNKHL